MSRWTFVATTPTGEALVDLVNATGRKLVARLTEPSTIEWSLSGRDPAAIQLVELSTDVVVYRDLERILRGRVGPTDDDLTGDGHATKYGAVDYRSLLARRTLWPGSTTVYTGKDQAAILADLIADSQALPGGDLGVTPDVGSTTGVLRDRTYEIGKNLGEAFDQLANVEGGFDWDIGPALTLDVYYPQRGTSKEFVAHYGSTVIELRRQMSLDDYANAVRYSGKDGVTPATATAADIASRVEGRWEVQLGDTEVSQATTLTQKANGELATRSTPRPAYVCKLRPGLWEGPATLWLGDTARLVVKSGRLDVDTYVRVHEVAIEIDDDGNEDVTVTFGRPVPSFLRRMRDTQRALTSLARR